MPEDEKPLMIYLVHSIQAVLSPSTCDPTKIPVRGSSRSTEVLFRAQILRSVEESIFATSMSDSQQSDRRTVRRLSTIFARPIGPYVTNFIPHEFRGKPSPPNRNTTLIHLHIQLQVAVYMFIGIGDAR